MRPIHAIPCLLIALALPGEARAQMAVADSGDTAWLMLCALLLLAAAMGGTRGRASAPLSLPAHGSREPLPPAAVAVLAAMLWIVIGYSLAYAPGSIWAGGAGRAMIAHAAPLPDGLTVPETALALFTAALAAYAAVLASGTVLDRVPAAWAMPFAALWTLGVHAPLARWLWPGGWLAQFGATDRCDLLAVQLSAGLSAIVAGSLLTWRMGRPAVEEEGSVIANGTLALQIIGILAIAGGRFSGATDAAAMGLTSVLAGAGAGLVAGHILSFGGGARAMPLPAGGLIGGAVAGLGAMGIAGPAGALLLGLAGGGATALIARLTPIFAPHAIGAMIGALLFVPLALEAGRVERGGALQLLVAQGTAMAVTMLWSAVVTASIVLPLLPLLPRAMAGNEEDARG
jgi:Amt family ammonium transporter